MGGWCISIVCNVGFALVVCMGLAPTDAHTHSTHLYSLILTPPTPPHSPSLTPLTHSLTPPTPSPFTDLQSSPSPSWHSPASPYRTSTAA